MAPAPPDRVRDEIARLGDRGLDVRGFALRAARSLARAVPFDGVCVVTIDPATGVPTGEVVENGLPPSASARMTEIEVRGADVNTFGELAASGRLAATLSEATGGDLDRSLRHRELRRPNGFGDELRAVFVAESGTWGAITLLREAGRPDFAPGEARLVASLSRHLAEGLQRAVLREAPPADDRATADPDTGLLLLTGDNAIEMANGPAESWLAELLEGGRPGGRIPPVIAAVASRARARGTADTRPASARVRAASGRWILVRGSVLGDDPGALAAVTLEAARSPELAPLVADAHGLTERERVITQLVAQGLPTAAIAARLHLSPYTVQDHLKSIFDKVGVSSRGGLVARLFFEHDEPRLLR